MKEAEAHKIMRGGEEETREAHQQMRSWMCTGQSPHTNTEEHDGNRLSPFRDAGVAL